MKILNVTPSRVAVLAMSNRLRPTVFIRVIPIFSIWPFPNSHGSDKIVMPDHLEQHDGSDNPQDVWYYQCLISP